MSVVEAFTGLKTKPVKFNFLAEQIGNAGKIEKTITKSLTIDCIIQESNPIKFEIGGAKIMYDLAQLVIYAPTKIYADRDFTVGDIVEIDGKTYTVENVTYRHEGGYTKIVTGAISRR